MVEINKAAVIGAGTMGLGIAGQLANAGVDVLLLDLPSTGENRNAIGERALERLLDRNQPGLLHRSLLAHITIGNIEDDLWRLADADWIAEAVVERLDVKRALYRRIDAVRKPGSIVSSNTSTIPIALLVAAMPAEFRAEFAITHFFNPVRYMRLLELVRGDDSRQEVIDCLDRFCDERLGKGIVICNDTPGFLGNRVGVFAIQTALHAAFRMGLEPEHADAVFGRPLGIPKTGVFGLYDLIGIDLMSDVAKSLDGILPPADAFHAVATEIPLLKRMIAEGRIGNKGGEGGFYRQQRGVRQTLDFERFTYRDFEAAKPASAIAAERAGDFTVLLDAGDEAGRYAWEVLSRTLSYAAQLVPDVNESLVAIDDAMKLGYNWLQGPFEMLDTIGSDAFARRLEAEGREVPAFVRTAAGRSFYRVDAGRLEYLQADGSYREIRRAPGLRRFTEERRKYRPVLANEVASYYVLQGGVGLVEFHSKANTLDGDSMQLIEAASTHATANCQALVIHNDAQHFSCGVNLERVLDFIDRDDFDGIDRFLDHFQQTVLALRNAPIPVVAAPSGLSLGGGFEVVLHCDKVIFHANSVTGLVETLVGVVPGGGGVKEMLYRWSEQEGDVTKGAGQVLTNVGYGKTAGSPLEARDLAMYRDGIDEFLMNRDRLLDTAIKAALAAGEGYAPSSREPLPMPGRQVHADMIAWLRQAQADGHVTAHDVTTGAQLAMIVSGGDVDPGTMMTEQELLDLERKAFVTLAQTPETRARIAHMLEFGKPLRN